MDTKNIVLYSISEKWLQKKDDLLVGADKSLIRVSVLEDLLQLVKRENVHLILLYDACSDRSLKSVIQDIQCIRGKTPVPIIVISDRTEEMAKIMLLDAGADDHVSIEDSKMVLEARITAHLRRYTELSSYSRSLPRVHRVGELEVDDMHHIVKVCGKDVRMTPIEFKILSLLVQERGSVLSIQQIYERIWKMQAIGAENVVAVHIRHVREKIEPNPKNPKYVKAVRGAGYKVG